MEEKILNYAKELDELANDGEVDAAIFLAHIKNFGTKCYAGGAGAELTKMIARAMLSNKDLARVFLEAVNLYELNKLKQKNNPDRPNLSRQGLL